MPRKPTTRRKTTGSKTGRRPSRWSPEQIAEWRQRDEQIWHSSTDYLEDADNVRQFAKDAAAGRVSARILGYSLRNQMLLEKQAAEFGFVLTDVKSAKEWRQFGRKVKAEWYGKNLRLVAPKNKGKAKDADPDAPTDAEHDDDTEADDEDTENEAGNQDGSEQAPAKTKFKTVAVFDIAQTEALPVEESPECKLCGAEAGQPCDPHCSCGACVDYQPEGDDAAEQVWNSLIQQIEKAEYTYDWPAPAAALNGARVHVDHDARTVYAAMSATADDPEAVADLAAALAGIIARADRANQTRRAERKAARLALTAAA